MTPYDALVLGGGPAGAAVAIALARRGLRTSLVERDPRPRARVGETLPPSARVALEALGVWPGFVAAGHERATGNRSAWGSGKLEEAAFICSPYGLGWHIDRPRFEAMLLDAAEAEGVTVLRGVRLDEVSFDGRAWRMTAGRPLTSRFAVDASGRGAFLARLCGASRVSIDRLVASVQFLDREDGEHESESGGDAAGGADPQGCFTLIEATALGWWYSARIPGGRLIAACMTDGDLVARAELRSSEGWRRGARDAPITSRRLAAYSASDARPRLWAAHTSRLNAVVGGGWLATGDAAVSFDPLSSQGITTALESGLDAADAILAHLEGDGEALGRYAAQIIARYRAYLVERARYYGAEGRWRYAPFWRRRQGHLALARSSMGGAQTAHAL